MDGGQQQQSFTIRDFAGYLAEHSGDRFDPGVTLDVGPWWEEGRPRSFRLPTLGGLEKSCGCSVFGQLWGKTPADVYGIYSWKGSPSGSTLLLAGPGGLARSRPQKADANAPFLLRFDALTLGGPAFSDPVTSAVSPRDIFPSFTEYQDRLYYTNGVDWPLRINRITDLFDRGVDPTVYPMGVFHPDLESVVHAALNIYDGERMNLAGVNIYGNPLYLASLETPYGESPARIIGRAASEDYRSSFVFLYLGEELPSANVGWSFGSFAPFVTGVKVYRVPAGSAIPQYVGTIRQGDASLLDTLEDGELGSAPPQNTGLPTNFRLLQTFEDRLFGVGGYGNPNRVACSQAGLPDQWPILFEIPLAADLGNSNVIQIAVINGNLYLFLESAILRLYGSSPENYKFAIVSGFVGCIAPRTFFPYEDGYTFRSQDGLYFFNGTNLRKITAAIHRDLERASPGVTPWVSSCAAVTKDFYYLSYREDNAEKKHASIGSVTSGETPNRTLAINLITGKVGVIDDWAFYASTTYGETDSIVVGGPVF